MEIFDRLLKFATIRPRSEFEIKRWFIRKKISSHDSERLFDELKKLRLVDDETFVRWWVGQRVEFRPKSRHLLLCEVIQKGVAKELAKTVLEQVEQELPTDEELAFGLVEKKKKSWEKLSDENKKRKIVYLLQSRGFGWGIIRKVFQSQSITSF